jgi:hypothetical protein
MLQVAYVVAFTIELWWILEAEGLYIYKVKITVTLSLVFN